MDNTQSEEGGRFALYKPENVDLAVVACKSLFLGLLISSNLTYLMLMYSGARSMNETIMKINIYIVFCSVFHFLEFLFTALYNNGEVDDDSFILSDWDLHLANGLAVIEFLVKSQFTSFSFTRVGLILIIVGQVSRSLAMYTARSSFNHYIQREKKVEHQLISHGIYRIWRHPSYFGFYWWFVGLQLFMGNLFCLCIAAYKLGSFFKQRIEFEEKLLHQFFGKEYSDYKSRTKTGIPFIA